MPDPCKTKSQPRPLLGFLLAMCGLASGLLAVPMLFYGITGVSYVLFRSPSRDRAGDAFGVVVFLTIGIVCVYFALRWCRAVRGVMAGK